MLDEGEDTGDIISQKAVGILADETSITLHNRLANLAPGLLIKAIKQCETQGGKPFHYLNRFDNVSFLSLLVQFPLPP